jgi:uncharacterized protein
MEFDWDAGKEAANRRKHGVSFEEAKTIFAPANPEIFADESHSDSEWRFIGVGFSDKGRVLAVAFTCPETDSIRVISARKATKREMVIYAKAQSQKD